MKERKTKKKRLICLGLSALLSLGYFLPVGVKAEASEGNIEAGVQEGSKLLAAEETVIEISDGYHSQTVTPNPYGSTTQTVYVHPKTKQVTISVTKAAAEGEEISYSYEPQLSMTEDVLYTAVDKITTSVAWDKEYEAGSAEGGTASQEQRELSGSTLLCLKRLQKPKVSLSVSAGAKSGYVPNSKNKVYIQARVRSDVESAVTIAVYNASDKEVYRKKFAASPNKLYEIAWNAKPSKGNQAGLSASAFVPKGSYKIVVEASAAAGGNTVTASKSKTFKVAGSGSVPTYGNDQKNMVPILTGDLETDYMAELILSKIIKDTMTNEQKIKAVYTWVVKNVKHDENRWDTEKFPVVYEKDVLSLPARAYLKECRQNAAEGKILYSNSYYTQSAADVLKRRVGVCSTISQTLQVLLNHLGFESSVVHGMYKNRNGSTLDHYWNNVKLNGKEYWLDVDVELSNWRGGSVNYYWYLKGDKEWKTNHIWYE